jgi:xanthine dehydrogenase accessory factor
MYNPLPIFQFVSEQQALGQGVVLVTVAAASANSSRGPGTFFAVSTGGATCGSLTGGCIEAAVAAEAMEVLRSGVPQLTRYGQGSRFLDIRLPCGGSLDLLFTPLSDPEFGADIVRRLMARQPFKLILPRTGHTTAYAPGEGRSGSQLQSDQLAVNIIPGPRCLIFGHGSVVEYLRDAGNAIGVDMTIYSPDARLVERIDFESGAARHLTSLTALPDLKLDGWTAAALLFHEHEWDAPILARLATTSAFFIGAMGSQKAHAARCEQMQALGCDKAAIARIVAPIGLMPAMRDPETLAVSVLAQIIQEYHRLFLACGTESAIGLLTGRS